MKRVALFFAVAMISAAVCAQKPASPFNHLFSYGVEVGMGSSNQQYTAGEVTGKPGISYMAGLSGYLNASRDFSIIFQPQYEWRMERNPAGHFRTDNVTLPLTIALTNGHSGSPLHYFVGLGGYWSNNLWGHCGDTPVDFDGAFDRREWGWQGYIALYYNHFGISITPRQSLTDMMRDTPADGVNWRVWSTYATLSWVF